MKKIIKNLLKKQNKIFYSCVIDDNPKFYWQGYIFINSLIQLAKVDGNRIFVHMIGKNEEFESFLNKYNVNIKFIEPWGDKKYCNKLQQLEIKELGEADFVFFCDADIAIIKDLRDMITDEEKVLGKLVDFDNPDIDTLKKIYDNFQVDYPRISNKTLNNKATFETNFNGGLYGVPAKYIEIFSIRWKQYASEMLKSSYIVDLLGNKVNHIDQISFSMTLQALKLRYDLIGIEYNCPTHIQNMQVVSGEIKKDVEVIHYHSNLSPIGLLNLVKIDLIDSSIKKINAVLQKDFNNTLFWDYRYKTNPDLGSGVGSRGEVAQYKLKILKHIGVEKSNDVLDIGCGDLEIIKNLTIKNYTGIDISTEALSIAQAKYPQHDFVEMKNAQNVKQSDTVLCLDVLIHQSSYEDYKSLIEFASTKTKKRLIISGYEKAEDSSHMCFFYENLKESLIKTEKFKYVFKIGEYRGLGLYMADRGDLSSQTTNNDLKNSIIDNVLDETNIEKDLLLESIVVSRNSFGWFTKHYPRVFEYPWLLEKAGRDLKDIKIADFGAGVTPLPLQLAMRGAEVFTVDKHNIERTVENVKNANEWGFFNYTILDNNIKSYNNLLDENLFKNNTFDIWYSISVVEHMPAEIRRAIFKIMRDTLKEDGKLFLTIDLVKDSENLWNMSEGKMVEDVSVHGTLSSFLDELKQLGFKINENQIVRMPKDERVDIALISGNLVKNKKQ